MDAPTITDIPQREYIMIAIQMYVLASGILSIDMLFMAGLNNSILSNLFTLSGWSAFGLASLFMIDILTQAAKTSPFLNHNT